MPRNPPGFKSPPRPGPGKKPKPKPAPSPEDVHSGRHAPPHPPPPKPKAPPPPPSPEDHRHETPAHRPAAAPPAPPAWILARQRRLRAAGFNVRVDGQWGPRSQAMWSAYQRGLRRAPVPVGKPPAPPRLNLAKLTPVAEITKGLPHSVKRKADAIIRTPDGRAGGGTLAVERRDTVTRLRQEAVQQEVRRTRAVAKRARAKPPEKMNLEDLVALVIDPVTHQFRPRNPGDARRVQRWLRAHGHAKLTVDGVWGKATFKALQSSYFAAKADEERKRIKHVSEQFYGSGVIRPGQSIPGLGKIHGPAELTKLLMNNSFGSAIAWRWMADKLHNDPAMFKAWRDKELIRLEAQSSTRAGGTVVLNPLVTSSLDRALRLAANLKPGEGGPQLLALAQANSWKDLSRALARIRAQDAAERRREMEKSKHHPWWQGAISSVVAPGQWVRHEVNKFGAVGYDIYQHAVDPFHHRLPQYGGGPNIEQQAEDFETWFAKEHFWMNLAYESAVDPINFVFPVAAAGVKLGVRGGVEMALRLESVGYGITRAGSLSRYGSYRLITKGGMALAAPARTGRVLKTGIGTEWDALKATPPGQFIRYTTEKATRLKQEAANVARARVMIGMRHGFRVKPLATEADFQAILKGTDTTRGIEELDQKLQPHVVANHRRILDALDKYGLSLFANDARGDHSGVGAALLARVAEVFRTNEVKRYAADKARAEYLRWLGPAGENKAAAEAAARKVYNEYIVRGGAYIRGAHDAEIAAHISPRVYKALDSYEHTFFRGIQDELERRAEARAAKLFDDTGNWIGRSSSERNLLRSMGAEAFDPKRLVAIKNTRFGAVFTSAERNSIVEQEIRGEVGRYRAWVGREAAEGRFISKEAQDTNITKIINRAEGGWARDGAKWQDTRKYIHVPDIYARQLKQFLGENLDRSGEVTADMLEGLGSLSAAPADAFATEVEHELESLAYLFLGGPTSDSKLAQGLDPYMFAYRPERETAQQALARNEAKGLIASQTELMGRAFNEALPRALRQEWAFYQALGESQGVIGRNTYRAIEGGLSAWIFLTLPLRPGWGVRNVIDNTAKVLTRGAHDPRVYWGEAIGAKGTSVFDLDLNAIRRVAAIFDERFGTQVSAHYDDLINTIWEHRTDVLQKIFRLHDIEVPAQVLEEARFNPFEHGVRMQRPSFAAKETNASRVYNETFEGELAAGRTPDEARALASAEVAKITSESFKDKIWTLMASRPENAAKRVLYRKVYAETLAKGGTELEAFRKAWAEVDHTLFDYSKITVIEDNLRPIFPFIQFWRKNTKFWLQTAVQKPWLPLSVYKFEQQMKDVQHADLPEWMRRYVHADEIADGLNQIPGLGWLAGPLANSDSMLDPLSFFSFAPLYRTFKSENPALPGEKAGLPFIGPMVDAMNDWGLSMNPLVRKPLEIAGVTTYRSWQSIFPQTPLVQAFTRQWLNDYFPNGLNIEALLTDETFGHLLSIPNQQEQIAKSFNQYVQMEMAGQELRGETVDRAKAEKKIRTYFLLNTIVGYFGGVYARRATPKDQWLWKMSDDFHKGTKEWNDLTDREKRGYQLYKRRKVDPIEFDRYVSMIPLIQGYYAQGSYKQKEHFKREHPEVLPFVEPAWSGKGIAKADYVHNAQLVQATAEVMAMSHLASELKLSPEVRKFAENLLVTDELRAFWAKNDTPADVREKQLRGQWHRYIDRLTDTYFAIPEDDFDGKAAFLKQHPVLEHWWLQNNTNSDDFKAIINASNADLRQSYFERLDAKDYKGADAFLHQFPFIFEFTKAADRVDPDTGEWIGNGKGGGRHGRHGLSQHAQDYLAAKSALNHYFYLDKSIRSKWLNGGSPDALKVKAYFSKYSHFHGGKGRGSTQHSRDYLKVAPLLKRFFAVAEKRGFDAAWDSIGPKETQRLQAYFRKYAHPKGHTQHAKDWIENKKYLDMYFKIPKSKRSDWLHGGSPAAEKVLAYFKKWGKMHQIERKFRNLPGLKSLRPELALRLKFWHKFWNLDPDARPQFILDHAEEYGIFVYGPIGQTKRDERVKEYLRQAHAHGLGEKAAMFLYVRPLLDFFFTLKNHDQKDLFLKANPELDYYFKHFVKQSPSGNKRLDKLIEGYFALPTDSFARTDYLKKHHEVQVYFNKKSTPAERAMHNLLEVYFDLQGQERANFGAKHPEIQAYFDTRKAEHDNEKNIGVHFAYADPRLGEFWNQAKVDITASGALVREYLQRHRGLGVRELQVRNERAA